MEVRRQGPSERPAEVLADVITKLRVLAAEDRGVLAILDAWDLGMLTRREVLRVTHLSPRAYDAAHKRLVRLARPLAAEVDEALDRAN